MPSLFEFGSKLESCFSMVYDYAPAHPSYGVSRSCSDASNETRPTGRTNISIHHTQCHANALVLLGRPPQAKTITCKPHNDRGSGRRSHPATRIYAPSGARLPNSQICNSSTVCVLRFLPTTVDRRWWKRREGGVDAPRSIALNKQCATMIRVENCTM